MEPMKVVELVVKYGFAVVLLAEVALVGRALVQLALEKARVSKPATPATQE